MKCPVVHIPIWYWIGRRNGLGGAERGSEADVDRGYIFDVAGTSFDAGAGGVEALRDQGLAHASRRAALVDKVMRMVDEYCTGYDDWGVRRYYYSYRWGRGKRREPSPCAGMTMHQDGCSIRDTHHLFLEAMQGGFSYLIAEMKCGGLFCAFVGAEQLTGGRGVKIRWRPPVATLPAHGNGAKPPRCW